MVQILNFRCKVIYEYGIKGGTKAMPLFDPNWAIKIVGFIFITIVPIRSIQTSDNVNIVELVKDVFCIIKTGWV